MKRTPLPKIAALTLIIIVLILSLSSCSLHDALLDEQLQLFVSAMNADDPSLLFSGMHPEIYREDFDTFYQGIKPLWRSAKTEDFRLTGMQVRTRKVNDERYGHYQGVWKVRFEDDYYQLAIVYDSDEKGSGITTMSFVQIPKTSTADTIFGIALVILVFAFLIYTAVDILRKKPRAYILVLILAVMLVFTIRIGTLKIAIPLGSIGYWVLRRKLLRKSPLV